MYAKAVGAAAFELLNSRVSGNAAESGDGGGVVVLFPEDTPENRPPDCSKREFRTWSRERSVTFVDNDVSYNTALSDGRIAGGVLVSGGGDVLFQGGNIHSNTARGSGGGVYIAPVSASVTFAAADVRNNTAAAGEQLFLKAGGGVAFHNVSMPFDVGPSQVRVFAGRTCSCVNPAIP